MAIRYAATIHICYADFTPRLLMLPLMPLTLDYARHTLMIRHAATLRYAAGKALDTLLPYCHAYEATPRRHDTTLMPRLFDA